MRQQKAPPDCGDVCIVGPLRFTPSLPCYRCFVNSFICRVRRATNFMTRASFFQSSQFMGSNLKWRDLFVEVLDAKIKFHILNLIDQ